jgi:hypothetical protein
MTLFIIGKVWLFAVIAGLIFLFPRQSRFLGLHFLLGATAGLLLAFVCLGIVSRLVGSAVAMGPVAMAVGGLLGVVVGSRIALKLNLALGWQAQRATK